MPQPLPSGPCTLDKKKIVPSALDKRHAGVYIVCSQSALGAEERPGRFPRRTLTCVTKFNASESEPISRRLRQVERRCSHALHGTSLRINGPRTPPSSFGSLSSFGHSQSRPRAVGATSSSGPSSWFQGRCSGGCVWKHGMELSCNAERIVARFIARPVPVPGGCALGAGMTGL